MAGGSRVGRKFTIGFVSILAWLAPVVVDNIFGNSSWPKYQRDFVSQVFKILMSPIVNLSFVTSLIGLALVILGKFQMRPSVVA